MPIENKDLICPDCKGELTFHVKKFVCIRCAKEYPLIEGIPVLLPTSLEPRKINEDNIWKIHSIERPKQPVWKALVHRFYQVRFVENEILPKFDFFRKKVLEIGAGSCWASAMIKGAERTCNYTATDVSVTALLKGKKMSELMETKLDRLICADVESLPFKDCSFDTVFGFEMLHHVEPRKAVAEIHRVLKKDGVLLMQEGVVNRLLRGFFRKYFSEAEKRSRKYGILEQAFTMNQLKKIFDTRFSTENLSIACARDFKYQNLSTLKFLLYKVLESIRMRGLFLAPHIIVCKKGKY